MNLEPTDLNSVSGGNLQEQLEPPMQHTGLTPAQLTGHLVRS